jgi:hypothetical protein
LSGLPEAHRQARALVTTIVLQESAEDVQKVIDIE